LPPLKVLQYLCQRAYHFFHFNYGGLEQATNYINTVGNIIDLPPAVNFEFTGNPEKFDLQ
jgi:hypothetical protein